MTACQEKYAELQQYPAHKMNPPLVDVRVSTENAAQWVFSFDTRQNGKGRVEAVQSEPRKLRVRGD